MFTIDQQLQDEMAAAADRDEKPIVTSDERCTTCGMMLFHHTERFFIAAPDLLTATFICPQDQR